jgi:hypothetical protein
MNGDPFVLNKLVSHTSISRQRGGRFFGHHRPRLRQLKGGEHRTPEKGKCTFTAAVGIRPEGPIAEPTAGTQI